eukprot:Selendium_serpulae@DN6521_c4_g2_i2.p1
MKRQSVRYLYIFPFQVSIDPACPNDDKYKIIDRLGRAPQRPVLKNSFFTFSVRPSQTDDRRLMTFIHSFPIMVLPSVRPSVSPTVRPSVFLSVSPSGDALTNPISPSVYPSVRQSDRPSVRLTDCRRWTVCLYLRGVGGVGGSCC